MSAEESMRTLTARLTDEVALEALLSLAHKEGKSPEERIVQAMLCDELEDRFPEVDRFMLDYIDNPPAGVLYADVLVASVLAVKEVAR